MAEYQMYDIVIRFTEDQDGEEYIATVTVGDDGPEEGSEDDESTFFHFQPDEWESLQDNFEFGTPVSFFDFVALRNAPEEQENE